MVDKIVTTKYRANDGSLWDTEEAALNRERKRKSGDIKECRSCEGTGKMSPSGDGRDIITCPVCEGRGYLERKEVWG